MLLWGSCLSIFPLNTSIQKSESFCLEELRSTLSLQPSYFSPSYGIYKAYFWRLFCNEIFMKQFLAFGFLFFVLFSYGQMASTDSIKVNKIPDLIPQKIDGKVGYVNQQREFVIKPQFGLAMFYNPDCNLINSSNKKAQKFGSADYATVEENKTAYRINKKGVKVYKYLKADLGKCPVEYKTQTYKAYVMQGYFGLVDKDSINEGDYREFVIYPQYQRLHVMEGDDIDNPMIVAVHNNKFGVIDKHAKVIIPFVYSDIKLNYSWKLAKMFEVSADSKEYFYIDENNVAY